MKTLKPCPFCGQEEGEINNHPALFLDEENEPDSTQGFWVYVCCLHCLTQGPAVKTTSSTEKKGWAAAIRKWNQRSMHNNMLTVSGGRKGDRC